MSRLAGGLTIFILALSLSAQTPDTATITGTADVTGLGAGSNVPFTFVAQGGGPGATFVLTVSGLTFREVLLEGASQVNGGN